MSGSVARTTRQTMLVSALLILLAVMVASPAHASSDAESRLLARHNEARAGAGLGQLTSHDALVGVARGWSARMRDDYEARGDRAAVLRHNPGLAGQLSSSYEAAGENVGYTVLTGASAATLADRLHTAYMNSEGHRRNILGDYDRAGVGIAMASDGTMWSTVVFMREDVSVRAQTAPAENEDAPPERPEPEPSPTPEPAPEPTPEPVDAASLFGEGWPEGYLSPGPVELPALLAATREPRVAGWLLPRRGPASADLAVLAR